MDLETFAGLNFPYNFKKSNLGIHDASRHLNREINSPLDQRIFDLGIHSGEKTAMYAHLPSCCFIIALSHRFADPKHILPAQPF